MRVWKQLRAWMKLSEELDVSPVDILKHKDHLKSWLVLMDSHVPVGTATIVKRDVLPNWKTVFHLPSKEVEQKELEPGSPLALTPDLPENTIVKVYYLKDDDLDGLI